MIALDKRTGTEAWRVDRDERGNWSTLLVWENALRTEIVTAGTVKVRSYDLDGKLLWGAQRDDDAHDPVALRKGRARLH